MKKIHGLLLILLVILTAASCEEDKYPDLEDGVYAEFVTTKGTILAKLHHDLTPMTVGNFVALAEGKHDKMSIDSLKGKPFYNGLNFHRVMKGFMIQGGDPKGTGSGDPGFKFYDEFHPDLRHDKEGLLSMANSGPGGTNGSQFFITHAPTPWLDDKHSIFGKVVQGYAVVDSIANTAVQKTKPVEPMIIKEVNIIRKGKEAKKWNAMDAFNSGYEKEKLAIQKVEEEKKKRIANAPAMIAKKKQELADLKAKAKKITGSDVLVYTRKKGNGGRPADGAKATIEYSGFLENGTLFDTNDLIQAQMYNAVNRNKEIRGLYTTQDIVCSPSQPQGVPGFNDALLSMDYGDEIVAFIPSELGFGEKGYGPIPANSDIVYEMKITKPEKVE